MIKKIKSSQDLQEEIEVFSDLRLLSSDKELQTELDDILEGGCEKKYDFYPFAEDMRELLLKNTIFKDLSKQQQKSHILHQLF